jgi:hypothetical protein
MDLELKTFRRPQLNLFVPINTKIWFADRWSGYSYRNYRRIPSIGTIAGRGLSYPSIV